MKLDILTNTLYTNTGKPIKTLHCPFQMDWDTLESTGQTSKGCHLCKNDIYDTGKLSEKEVVKKVNENPEVCLKIDADQDNIEIITFGEKITVG